MYLVVNDNLEYANKNGLGPYERATWFDNEADAMDRAIDCRNEWDESFAVVEPAGNNAVVYVADA